MADGSSVKPGDLIRDAFLREPGATQSGAKRG
jgi:hypothetical protein